MSFLKTYAAGVTFFTIGDSLIGGTDIIKGTGAVVQEWDKYDYEDYTNRVIGFEYTRELDKLLGGSILAIADVSLNNHDDYFTPGSGSAISADVLPRRPIKLFAGFKDEQVPVFIGLTERMPDLDDKSKVAKFHCVDFMQEIFNTPLDTATLLENKRTDEVISTLLQAAGLTTSQFTLDTGFNVIAFSYFEKGAKLGDALRKLCQSELGSITMDEEGRIRFINRTNWNTNAQVWEFDKSKIIDLKTAKQDALVNVVEVKSNVREVLANQKFWELQAPIVVPANSTVEIWADFTDPVTGVDTPLYVTGATTSSYTTNLASDGSGATYDASISLSSIDVFANSAKMVFANSHATTPVYITSLELFATPAKVVKKIYVREEDATSVAKYGEITIAIENDFIQDESTATSIAKIILADNSSYGETLEITVKGVPQIQIGDVVQVTTDNINQTYYVSKVVGKMVGARFIQTLTIVKKTFQSYFRVGISLIGGTDKIAP
jgi:hypothetical protein